MNIFILDYDVDQCTKYLVDSHASKMVLETAQLLCTTLNLLGIESPYKSCHMNHPCRLWTGKSRQNFSWLLDYGKSLSKEFTHRYNKKHASENVILKCSDYVLALPDGPLTSFAQAMPEEFKCNDAVKAYRNYYNGAKTHLFKWTNREVPKWVNFKYQQAI